MVQYKTNVKWDVTLCALEFIEDDAITREAKIAGLCQFAIKITTGAPTATANKFIKAAQIQNAVDGTWYENTGTSASPVWSLVPSSGSGITQLTGDVTAGPGNGSKAATIAAGAVTLAKLATGVAPAYIVKFAGKITWSGSGASLATTISGVLATDIVLVTIQKVPTQAGYVLSAAPTTDTLTIVLSTANTSNDAIIAYTVLRAAS